MSGEYTLIESRPISGVVTAFAKLKSISPSIVLSRPKIKTSPWKISMLSSIVRLPSLISKFRSTE
jgi:hypothetical protein